MRKKSVAAASIDTIQELLDAVPVDRLTDVDLPDLSVPDISVPDLSDVIVAVTDAGTVVADTAAVIGRRGSSLATRSVSATWRHRETVATVAVIAVIALAIAAFLRRRGDDDQE